MKILIVLITGLIIIGCSPLPRLPKVENTIQNLNIRSNYKIEQLDSTSESLFKLTSPQNEKILFNLYKKDGTLVGTLYNGQGGIKLIRLDSLSMKYNFKLKPENYYMVLYGEKGKAIFDLKIISTIISSNGKVSSYDESYYKKLAKQTAYKDSITGKICTKPFLIGGIKALSYNIIYPIEAVKNKIQGTIIINYWVNLKGDVTKVELVKGLGYGLDEQVINAIKKAKYLPGTIDDKDVEMQVTMPLEFRLD